MDNLPEVLLSREAFHKRLAKERSRVDRFGGEVSLLVLAARDERSRSETLQATADILASRIRDTDEVGWFDADTLAVILPGTDAEGAWCVADAVFERLPADVIPPASRVYTYPHGDTFPTEDGEKKATTVRSGMENSSGRPRPVLPLQALFMERLPWPKRLLDIAASGLALIALLPLFALVALGIKFTDPGPVFYSQRRMGRGRQPFRIYKFRSMYVDADRRKAELMALNEADGPAFKITNDPRVTPLGRYLRSTCIDELPQLWNVFRGDMSLVGPRPLAWDEALRCLRWQNRRFDITPGLTCLWQVQPARNSMPFADWMRLDLDYVRSGTFRSDIRLIWRTGVVMLGGKGI